MTRIVKSISKEDLQKLPIKSFNGNIHIVNSDEKVKEAVDFLNSCEAIGFDTETKPVFKKGQTNGVAILQLSTATDAFIFKLKKTYLPKSITNILSSQEILKIGVAIRDDIIALKKINNFKPTSFIELQDYVKQFKIENFSLQKLTAIVLGFKISKSKRLSNWEAKILTKAQLSYAATDAWASLMVYEELRKLK